MLQKNLQLLYKWQDAYELRNKVLEIFYKDSFTMLYFLAMQAFLISPGTKSFSLESFSYLAAWCA